MTAPPVLPLSFPEGVGRDVRTPDGRTLACLAVGDPRGPLVLHNHGGPSSRLEVRLLGAAAAALGLHLVGIDRPGQGRSSAQLMYELLELETDRLSASLRKQMLQAACPYDAEFLGNDALWEVFLAGMRGCFRQGAEGLVRDARVLYEAWAFDVSCNERRVHMWQGMQDRFVPPPINRAVADAMPGAVWHAVDEGGHFIAVGEAHAILSIARDEVAG